jgi:hypothetical protein
MSDLEKLALLRKPFTENQISQLPKPDKRQTEIVKNDYRQGIRCTVCGGWHHKDVIHLPYVGHAALTDRLLDCDPEWNWEPLSLDSNGLPMIKDGGLWIKLTVCGVTRLGYGDADDKKGGNAIKEMIGDALRNAAMRFGAALDLWHKGDLHVDDEEPTGKERLQVEPEPQKPEIEPNKPPLLPNMVKAWTNAKAAYKRDGNFYSILQRYSLSAADKTLLMQECDSADNHEVIDDYDDVPINWIDDKELI